MNTFTFYSFLLHLTLLHFLFKLSAANSDWDHEGLFKNQAYFHTDDSILVKCMEKSYVEKLERAKRRVETQFKALIPFEYTKNIKDLTDPFEIVKSNIKALLKSTSQHGEQYFNEMSERHSKMKTQLAVAKRYFESFFLRGQRGDLTDTENKLHLKIVGTEIRMHFLTLMSPQDFKNIETEKRSSQTDSFKKDFEKLKDYIKKYSQYNAHKLQQTFYQTQADYCKLDEEVRTQNAIGFVYLGILEGIMKERLKMKSLEENIESDKKKEVDNNLHNPSNSLHITKGRYQWDEWANNYQKFDLHDPYAAKCAGGVPYEELIESSKMYLKQNYSYLMSFYKGKTPFSSKGSSLEQIPNSFAKMEKDILSLLVEKTNKQCELTSSSKSAFLSEVKKGTTLIDQQVSKAKEMFHALFKNEKLEGINNIQSKIDFRFSQEVFTIRFLKFFDFKYSHLNKWKYFDDFPEFADQLRIWNDFFAMYQVSKLNSIFYQLYADYCALWKETGLELGWKLPKSEGIEANINRLIKKFEEEGLILEHINPVAEGSQASTPTQAQSNIKENMAFNTLSSLYEKFKSIDTVSAPTDTGNSETSKTENILSLLNEMASFFDETFGFLNSKKMKPLILMIQIDFQSLQVQFENIQREIIAAKRHMDVYKTSEMYWV